MFKLKLLIFLLLSGGLSGCNTTKQGINACTVKQWSYKVHGTTSLTPVTLRKKDVENIKDFMALYRVTNFKTEYNRLTFQELLWNEVKQHRVYRFGVNESLDVQAVYITDNNDNLLDNYLVYSQQQNFKPTLLKPWKMRIDFHASYSMNMRQKQDEELIQSLIKLYRLNSADSYFSELTFDKVLTNESNNKAFVFDLQSVNHTQIVFVLDENNKLINNFMTSSWYH